MTQQISVVAVAQATAGHGPRVEAAIRVCIPETRKEHGCLLYTVHRDLDRGDRFVFIEKWVSRAALDLHTATPHFTAMVDAMTPWLQEPLSIAILSELP